MNFGIDLKHIRQEVAVDILVKLEDVFKSEDVPPAVYKVFNDTYDKYDLCTNPTTQYACTTKEYLREMSVIENKLNSK